MSILIYSHLVNYKRLAINKKEEDDGQNKLNCAWDVQQHLSEEALFSIFSQSN